MRAPIHRPRTTTHRHDDDLWTLIAAAAEVVPATHLPRPSRRSHVVLFPMDGSRRGLPMLAPKVRTRWLVPAIVVWTLGMASLLLANRPAQATLPAAIRGVWAAGGGRAGPERLVIGERTVAFESDPVSGAGTVHAITGVSWSQEEAGVRYRIGYAVGRGGGGTNVLEFVYEGPIDAHLVMADDPGTAWRAVAQQ